VGEPIAVSGRPTREALAELTATTCAALHELVADAPDVPVPGPVGRWVTERFNDWPEGSREKARMASEAAMRPASEGTGLPYSKPSD
jgi:hypothetical protein